jgi:alkane 1-monooxygenase
MNNRTAAHATSAELKTGPSAKSRVGMSAALPFALAGVGLVSAIIGITLGGWALVLPVVVLYALLPVIDHLVGINRDNPHPDAPPSSAVLHDLMLFSFVPVQMLFIGWAIDKAITAEALLTQVGIAIDIGVITGSFGITIGHELMHRREALPRALAELLMASVTYTWFCVEHVYGHHRNIGTPSDPATSRRNESLYGFLPRTLVGTVASAVRLERKRLAKRKISAWSLQSRLLRYPLGVIALYALVFGLFGAAGVAVFVLQSVVAVVMLEIINYIEHYGLQRRQLDNGRFEKVRPKHSWNASHRISNWMLFNLARHSDHHAYAARPYYALRHHDEVPQMPSGYGAMFLLALAPPLWFRVMNPLADSWNARGNEDTTK